MKNMGHAVRRHRKAMQMNQAALGRKAGTSGSHISNIERGNHWPAMPLYLRLCAIFNKPLPPLTETDPS